MDKEIVKSFVIEMHNIGVILKGAIKVFIEVIINILEGEPEEIEVVVFPSNEEAIPKGIPSPAKLKKGKTIIVAPVDDKEKDADLDEDYFEEGDEEMVRTISIISIEYLGEYEENPNEDYAVEDEKAFAFMRPEVELDYLKRPTEKQNAHLRPLHVIAYMSGICVNKVLVDRGATISLLPERMLVKVGKHANDLIPTNISVTDYSGTVEQGFFFSNLSQFFFEFFSIDVPVELEYW
ncbi:hypothetical protein Ahy_A09g046081 [Arachis hypogaea]|uniref:Aspartic peptidase DDI1-type domain-containing protein n=1 Tax=Arachis hypogaea TaxID=3818 RepID=A0A445BNU1_ARAHY|nr:hypothetical protein Ahy_A09g046081 [Arachis hypogaea]